MDKPTQPNFMPTDSTDTLSETRRNTILAEIIPALEQRVRELAEENKLPSFKYPLRDFLVSENHLGTMFLADQFTELSGQHVFSGEVPYIYQQLGLEYQG